MARGNLVLTGVDCTAILQQAQAAAADDFYLGRDITGQQFATVSRERSPNIGVVLMSDVHPSGATLWENGYLRKPFSAEEPDTAVATVAGLYGSQTILSAAAATMQRCESAGTDASTFEPVSEAPGWGHRAESSEASARAFLF